MPRSVQRVLVPLDAGERAGPLLDLVERFDLPDGADVRLLHVVPAGSSRARIRLAWEHLARKASGGRGPRPSHTVLVGDPAREIVQCAAAAGAGLIVLRSRTAGGPATWTRGSVAERIIRESPVPVLLLASSSRDRAVGALRRILVPVQGPTRRAGGEEEDRRSTLAVLRLVTALARRQEAVVQLLAVVEPWGGGVGLVARRAKAEAYLEELHGSLGGVAALRRVVTGSQEVEVTKSLADEDLLAVAVRRDQPGPIGEALLRRCPCALLTVPAP